MCVFIRDLLCARPPSGNERDRNEQDKACLPGAHILVGTYMNKLLILHSAIFMKRVKQRTIKGLEECHVGCAVLIRVAREGMEMIRREILEEPCKHRKDISGRAERGGWSEHRLGLLEEPRWSSVAGAG